MRYNSLKRPGLVTDAICTDVRRLGFLWNFPVVIYLGTYCRTSVVELEGNHLEHGHDYSPVSTSTCSLVTARH